MIKLVKGDITKIDYVEAIVNAANSSLLGGGNCSEYGGRVSKRKPGDV